MNPTQLGPYTIGQRLGRGGMGAVYEAVDTATGKAVAVKVLASHLADDAGLRRRFDAEIDALKNLRHPGIVRLIAFGEQDEQPYFAMELVHGRSLEQILRDGKRFSWRETIAKAAEIARALKAAHDVGIVHRDLKPANLLIADVPQVVANGSAPAGEEAISVKLADFGIAKLFGGSSHTAAGHVVGTAEYMAPEQATGRPLDHRADLYALGLVMYAMLTGGPPFRGGQLAEIIEKQRRAVPPRVSSLVKDIPPELDELIARLLAKEPAQRPASALALGRLLSAIETLHAPAAVAKPPAPRGGNPPTGAPPAAARPRLQTAGPAPTALDRSNRQTRPVAPSPQPPAATRPEPTAGHAARPRRGPDPLAPTIDLAAARPAAAGPSSPATEQSVYASMPAAMPGGGTGHTATAAHAAGQPALPTGAASATTLVDGGRRDRFMTVEDLEQAEADHSRREDFLQALRQWLAAAGVAAAVAFVAWFFLAPPSADTLHARIMAIIDAKNSDTRDARSLVEQFLDRYAADPRAEQIRQIKRQLDIDQLERRSRRPRRGDRDVTPIERDYRAAMAREKDGPNACLAAIHALLAVHARPGVGAPVDEETSLWLDLARRQVDRLTPDAEAEQRDDADKIAKILAAAELLAAQSETSINPATQKDLARQRRSLLEGIVTVYADRPHAAEFVSTARALLGDGENGTPPAAAPATPSPAASIPVPSTQNE